MRLDKVKVETPAGIYMYPVSIFSGLIRKNCFYCGKNSLEISKILNAENDFIEQPGIDRMNYSNFDILILLHCNNCSGYTPYHSSASWMLSSDIIEPGHMEGPDEVVLSINSFEDKIIRKIKNQDFSKKGNYATKEALNLYTEASIAMNMGFEDIAGMGFRRSLEECIYNICRDNDIVLTTTNKNDITSSKPLAKLLRELKNANVISEYQYQLYCSITYLGNDRAHAGEVKHPNISIEQLKELLKQMLFNNSIYDTIQSIVNK